LGVWVAHGHARELHFSSLGGLVTDDGVLAFLRTIHRKGLYPLRNSDGSHEPLWLRLENNGIEDPEQIVGRGRAEGMGLRVVEKADLSRYRPRGTYQQGAADKTAINLALFRYQHPHKPPQDAYNVVASHVHPNQRPPPQDTNVAGGRELLRMLQPKPNSARNTPERRPDKEPLSLSADEFLLREMEAREDEEGGADQSNWDTFGEDAAFGFSFEENLRANEKIGNGVGRRKNEEPHQAREEIEEEIRNIIVMLPMLQRSDFDGQVRQYLHAIRSVGGRSAVVDAMAAIQQATEGRTRESVQKWPAFLISLLKQCHRQRKEEHRKRKDERHDATRSEAVPPTDALQPSTPRDVHQNGSDKQSPSKWLQTASKFQ
jgi:hypothetical protein